MSYLVKPKQHLIDIALQVYGDVRGLAILLEDNPELTPQSLPAPGSILKTRKSAITNEVVVKAYQNENRILTTSDIFVNSGIGFDAIQYETPIQ